jgi:sterol-4alpha-carboxylate 3-dehydrogenase (decarboxylating)
VLESNCRELATVAIRPSGIFGPGDMQGTWQMFMSAKKGMHKVLLGNNTTLFDFTYVDNIAYSHLLAAQKLSIGSPVSGQVLIYLIHAI